MPSIKCGQLLGLKKKDITDIPILNTIIKINKTKRRNANRVIKLLDSKKSLKLNVLFTEKELNVESLILLYSII
jgi:hypothetical protein